MSSPFTPDVVDAIKRHIDDVLGLPARGAR